jgi:hypothetical protein
MAGSYGIYQFGEAGLKLLRFVLLEMLGKGRAENWVVTMQSIVDECEFIAPPSLPLNARSRRFTKVKHSECDMTCKGMTPMFPPGWFTPQKASYTGLFLMVIPTAKVEHRGQGNAPRRYRVQYLSNCT